MCNVKRLHIKFKQDLNKLDSNHKKDFPPAFIDDFLYEAALDYVDIVATGDLKRAHKYGFEVTQQRIDMLSTLVIDIANSDDAPLVPISSTTEFGFNKYEFNLGSAIDPYMHLARSYAVTGCGNIGIQLEQHGDLNTILMDSYRQPSAKWKRALGVIKKSSNSASSSLYVYLDIDIEGINGQYIKRPVKPFFGGYDTLEYLNGDASFPNSLSPSIDTDIPESYCNLLVSIAVQNVSGKLGDYNNTSYLQQKLINQI